MRELNFDLQRFNLVTISSRNYFDVRTFSQEYHVYGDYPSNGRYYFDDEDARVVLSNAAYNTIHCGDGNDTIIDGGYHVSLNAGAGNDKIYMPTCDYGTILPGTGNDTIDIDPINNRGDGNVLIYRAGDGNDVISSAGAGFDTLKIYGNYLIDGKVIRVGSGSITFVDGISRSLVVDAIAGHMKYNGPELNLDYFKQAMTEEAETNLEGFLGYCDTSSVMQSILNDGKDSQYLSEVSSEQAQEISDTLKSLYEQAANLQHLKESQISDEVYRANLDEISKTLDSLSNSLGMLDVGLVLVGSESLNPAIAVIVNIANIAVKTEELHISEKKLLEKYPDYGSHAIDYGTPISVWQGAAPFGIEIPISVYEEQFRANDYWAKKN